MDEYFSAIATYLTGDREQPLRWAAAVDPDLMIAIARRARDRWSRQWLRANAALPVDADACASLVRLAEGAAAFHLDRVVVAASLDDKARESALSRMAVDWLVEVHRQGASSASAEASAAFRRQWFVASLLYAQGQGYFRNLDQMAREAIATFPADAELQLIAGTIDELLASPLIRLDAPPGVDLSDDGRDAADRRRRALLAAMEHFAGAVHDPRFATESRLRQGHCALELGDASGAARYLADVATGSATRRQRYLASLLLGRMHARAGRDDDARRTFERAVAEAPEWQSAYVGLAHVEYMSGAAADALRTVGEGGARAGRGASGRPAVDGLVAAETDPWRSYHLGVSAGFDAAMSTLRSLVAP
ncbi:MAG: hypothetical protein U0Q12_25645 [Vicinamibacterales bacterium]